MSGGTLIKDAEYLLNQAGAISVDACFIHANLGVGAVEKLNNSPIKTLFDNWYNPFWKIWT